MKLYYLEFYQIFYTYEYDHLPLNHKKKHLLNTSTLGVDVVQYNAVDLEKAVHISATAISTWLTQSQIRSVVFVSDIDAVILPIHVCHLDAAALTLVFPFGI